MPKKKTKRKQARQVTRGPRGERGARGAPGIEPEVIEQLLESVEQLRAEAEIQLHRMADLQAQLDVALAKFRAVIGASDDTTYERRQTSPGRRRQ